MKIKRNPIASAIKKALYSGLVASVAFSSLTYAQEDTDRLSSIELTGTNIRGVDFKRCTPSNNYR